MLKTKKKVVNEVDWDTFNRYCLKYFDGNGEPFMYMSGTQIVQNPKCYIPAKDVLNDYRNSINKK